MVVWVDCFATTEIDHKLQIAFNKMTYYSCFDQKGNIIARCQTKEDINVLKKMGRPIVEIKEMKNEESVVCSLTGSPSDYNEDY